MSQDSREQFGREAEKYLSSKAHDDASALSGLAALLPERLGRTLDVGTGAGHMAFALAPKSDRTIALDPTVQMLEIVGREAARRGLRGLSTVLAFAERLPFATEAFGVVTCRIAAHHFDGPDAFVRESARTLSPGGRFLLVDTVAPDDPEADAALNRIETVRDPSHRRDWTVPEWEARIRSVGLEVESVRTRSKPLDFHDWTARMSVAPEDEAWLVGEMETAEGALQDYLKFDGASFHLTEMTLLARKPG